MRVQIDEDDRVYDETEEEIEGISEEEENRRCDYHERYRDTQSEKVRPY
jgi:hypothetical protein